MTSELRTLDDTDRFGAGAGAQRFEALLAGLIDAIDGAVLVSQDRCVDGLLDLYNAAPTEVVRVLVAEIIDEMRHVSAVRASDLLGELAGLRAAIAVECAFFD